MKIADKRFVVAYMTENHAENLCVSLMSIENKVDKVYIIYSHAAGDQTMQVIDEFKSKGMNIEVHHDAYPHEELGSDGIQRDKYLKILKEKEMGNWCLVLDSDEVVDDIGRLRAVVNLADDDMIFDIKMRHLVYSFGYEDITVTEHFVKRRLFRIAEDLKYGPIEHVLLDFVKPRKMATTDAATIWHLSLANNMFRVRKKHLNDIKKVPTYNNFFRKWYLTMLTGRYPIKPIILSALPKALREYFLIPDIEEEIYFYQRMSLETKHFIDAHTWKEKFNPKNALCCGCGTAHRVYTLSTYGIDAYGFDKSKFTIEHCQYANIKKNLWVGDIRKIMRSDDKYDLVTAYDVLEHLREEDVPKALAEVYRVGSKNFIFSIPFLGDLNLEMDETHLTKRNKEWWIKQITDTGFNVEETPADMLYSHQVIVCTK